MLYKCYTIICIILLRHNISNSRMHKYDCIIAIQNTSRYENVVSYMTFINYFLVYKLNITRMPAECFSSLLRIWYMYQQVGERDLKNTFKYRVSFKTLLLRKRKRDDDDSHPLHVGKLCRCTNLPSPPIWRARREFVLERLLGNHPRWHLWYILVTNETSLIRDARQINALLLME